MKQIYTLTFLLCLLSLSVFAQTRPVNTVISWWGNWSNKSSWSLNRVPEDGDSVIIPAGKGIVFNQDESYDNLYIVVKGTLQIKKKMKLDDQSVVEIEITGLINAFGANRKKEVIEIDGKDKYDQHSMYSIIGPSVANKSTGISPNGFTTPGNVLPVKFIGFDVTATGKTVQLNWSTAEELNNSHFEIEKSVDGYEWKKVTVIFGAGTTTSVTKYSYTDKNDSEATVYYRIRQVDVNGRFQYTAVRKVSSKNEAPAVTIYTPSKQIIIIDFKNEVRSNIQVRVVNMNGQVVASKVYEQASYKINMHVASTDSGVYVVQVSDNRGWQQAKKIVF